MRKIAYDYFVEQVGYQIAVSGKVKNAMLKDWLDGMELNEILTKWINTPLMIDSVKRCKEYINLIVSVDIDSDKVTREICLGFFDYLTSLYNEFEAKYVNSVPTPTCE